MDLRKHDPLGALGAVGLVLAVLVFVTVPMTAPPLIIEGFFPEVQWRSPFQWWWVVLGAVVIGIGSYLAIPVEAAFTVMFPHPEQKWLLAAMGSLTTAFLLAGLYSLVLAPFWACLLSAVAALGLTALLERFVPFDELPGQGGDLGSRR